MWKYAGWRQYWICILLSLIWKCRRSSVKVFKTNTFSDQITKTYISIYIDYQFIIYMLLSIDFARVHTCEAAPCVWSALVPGDSSWVSASCSTKSHVYILQTVSWRRTLNGLWTGGEYHRHGLVPGLTQSNQSMSASPGFFDKCNFFVAELRKSAKALSKLPLWCLQNRLFSKIVSV